MKSYMKAGVIVLVIMVFWIYIFWALADVFGFGLAGVAVGLLVGTGCILFGLYGLKQAIIKDLNARRVTTGMYADLNRVVADFAYKENVPKPEIYEMNEHAPHAFSVGTNMKTAALFVTKGLVENLNEDEMKAYILHELVHIRKGDHYAADLGAGMAYILLYPTRMFDHINDGENVGKLLTILVFGPFAAVFTQLAAYRGLDYEADAAAAEFHGQGFSLASALNTGQKDIRKHPIRIPHYMAHLFTVEPITSQTQAGALFVSHVPTPKRIAKLKRSASKVAKAAVYKHKGIS